MEFGDKLKAIREENHWTQEDLAEKLYVSRVTISKWETGRGLPNLDSLLRLSDISGISINDLISTEKAIECGRNEVKEGKDKAKLRFLFLLDVLTFLLLVLPIFRSVQDGAIGSVSLFVLSTMALWQKTVIVLIISIEVLIGLVSIFREKSYWKLSLAASLFLIVVLVLALQPYPSLFALILLSSKIFIQMLR